MLRGIRGALGALIARLSAAEALRPFAKLPSPPHPVRLLPVRFFKLLDIGLVAEPVSSSLTVFVRVSGHYGCHSPICLNLARVD